MLHNLQLNSIPCVAVYLIPMWCMLYTAGEFQPLEASWSKETFVLLPLEKPTLAYHWHVDPGRGIKSRKENIGGRDYKKGEYQHVPLPPVYVVGAQYSLAGSDAQRTSWISFCGSQRIHPTLKKGQCFMFLRYSWGWMLQMRLYHLQSSSLSKDVCEGHVWTFVLIGQHFEFMYYPLLPSTSLTQKLPFQLLPSSQCALNALGSRIGALSLLLHLFPWALLVKYVLAGAAWRSWCYYTTVSSHAELLQHALF